MDWFCTKLGEEGRLLLWTSFVKGLADRRPAAEAKLSRPLRPPGSMAHGAREQPQSSRGGSTGHVWPEQGSSLL